MRGLGIPLLALALSAAPAAGAAPQVELTPAWAGWSRPGRVTEVGVRVRADAAARGTLEILAGPQSVRTPVNLAAGETLQIEVPVTSAATLEVTIDLEGAPPESRAQALSLSESPLLGVGLASGETARLEGFHAVRLVPADLPRGAAAYASVDALVLDAATLRALEPRQLGALIGHAAACGRIALVSPDPGAWRVLEGAAGCGARTLVSGESVAEALMRLEESLAVPASAPPSTSDLAALLRPEATAWPRIVAVLATFFGIAALAVTFTASPTVLLLVPVLASAVLAALPENFAFMGHDEADKLAIAEDDAGGPIQTEIASLARELGLWIVAGTVPLRVPGEGRVAAACLVFDAEGQRVARYDKIHLFDVAIPGREERYQESASVRPGKEPVCVATPAGVLGLAVCYDLRFPELFRRLVDLGAEWFCLPSAFTAPTGRAHWETLLRARAIENFCHVVAPAQSGFHENGRETYGDSMIVDCWGRVLARLPRGSGAVVAEIDLVRQREVRQNFPSLDHRRLAQ